MDRSLGVHIILDLYNITNNDITFYVKDIKSILLDIVRQSKLNMISFSFHQFEPYGVTGIILLEESHISIHTWPEKRYVAIDIYTCGDHNKAYTAKELILNIFKPEYIKQTILERGIFFTK